MNTFALPLVIFLQFKQLLGHHPFMENAQAHSTFQVFDPLHGFFINGFLSSLWGLQNIFYTKECW